MTDSVNRVIQRHLDQLKKEISAYKNEDDLWEMTGEIPNCAGNLCLHLCGNLQHYIGANLGDTGYIRQRDKEFSDKHIPVSDLVNLIEVTSKTVSETLLTYDKSKLTDNYPEEVFGYPMTIEFFLIHLVGHLGYHIGQVNYHRRLIKT
ncbi:MAG: DUF1572 family protein [Bacteroidota bacterium]